MKSVETLIDSATAVCGTRYQLAKRLNESEGNLSKVANGKRGITPRLAAHLAAIANEDPREAALIAVLDQARDDDERKELARILHLRDWRKR